MSSYSLHQRIAIKHLERMSDVWGLNSGKWVEHRFLAEIVDTVNHMKKEANINNQEVFEILKISSSRYCSWLKLLKDVNFSKKRPTRRRPNKLLPKEVKAILQVNLEMPGLSADRLASFLRRYHSVYVSASSIRYVLKEKRIRLWEVEDVFLMEERPPYVATEPMKILVELNSFISDRAGNHFTLSCVVDQYSQAVLGWIVGLIDSNHTSAGAQVLDALGKESLSPKIEKTDSYLAATNELSACLSIFGFSLSKTNPLEYTMNPNFGKYRGMRVRENSHKWSSFRLEETKEYIAGIMSFYNKSWSNRNLDFFTVQEVNGDREKIVSLRAERKKNLERSYLLRSSTNKRHANQLMMGQL